MATFTAVGSSAELLIKSGQSFSYSISNTFVAKVSLQKIAGDNVYQILASYTSTLSSTTVKNTSGSDQKYRLTCTDFTSGTVTYTLAHVDNEAVLEFQDKDGKRLGYFDDAGGLVVTGLTNSGSTTITGNVTVARLLNCLIDETNSFVSAADITKKVNINANGITAAKTVTLAFSDTGSDITLTFPSSAGVLAAASGAASNGQVFGGSSTTFTNKVLFSGGLRTKVAVTDTANPPTQAEMVTAFGAAATTGAGFVGVINDNALGVNTYFVWSDGANYFYVLGTVGA